VKLVLVDYYRGIQHRRDTDMLERIGYLISRLNARIVVVGLVLLVLVAGITYYVNRRDNTTLSQGNTKNDKQVTQSTPQQPNPANGAGYPASTPTSNPTPTPSSSPIASTSGRLPSTGIGMSLGSVLSFLMALVSVSLWQYLRSQKRYYLRMR
jgi:predicted PurR-regulated permease PerM